MYGEREERHMAVLAPDHFTERIVGAVVSARLPFRTQILQAEEREAGRIYVVLVILKIAGTAARQSDVVAALQNAELRSREIFA